MNKIKIGYLGKILEGDDKNWYIAVQKDPEKAGGYIIFRFDKENKASSTRIYDFKVDNRDDLIEIFDTCWNVEWSYNRFPVAGPDQPALIRFSKKQIGEEIKILLQKYSTKEGFSHFPADWAYCLLMELCHLDSNLPNSFPDKKVVEEVLQSIDLMHTPGFELTLEEVNLIAEMLIEEKKIRWSKGEGEIHTFERNRTYVVLPLLLQKNSGLENEKPDKFSLKRIVG